MDAAPRISIIIPAYNEEAYLPRLLESIEVARERYGADRGAVEVVVADNGSTDGTAAVAARFGCRVVPVEERCIAAARNGGALAARGELLGFIDADSAVHPGSLGAIDRAMSTGRCVGGATGLYMERWSAGIAAAYAVMIPLVWVIGLDTGLVFCRRSDFEALGGYDRSLRFAEDLHFYWRLKRLGARRGESFVRLRSFKALGSTRKFDQHGDWHYFAMLMKAPLYLTLRRRSMNAFADEYWYSGKRTAPRELPEARRP